WEKPFFGPHPPHAKNRIQESDVDDSTRTPRQWPRSRRVSTTALPPSPSRLDLDIQLCRCLRKVTQRCRAQPPLHPLLVPAVDVAAAFFSELFQHDLGVGEETRGKDGQEALVSPRKVGGRHIDHRVGTADERLTDEAHAGVVEDPQALPLVRLDDEDAVLHGHTPCCVLRWMRCIKEYDDEGV